MAHKVNLRPAELRRKWLNQEDRDRNNKGQLNMAGKGRKRGCVKERFSFSAYFGIMLPASASFSEPCTYWVL